MLNSTEHEIPPANKNLKIPTNKEVSCFKSLRGCIYHAKMPTIVGNFNIYEQDKFRAQLSWAWKIFIYHAN